MKRRWIIRGLFIGIALLCVIGWVGFQGDRAWQIRYTSGQTLILSCFEGHIHITWINREYTDSNGWYFEWDGETSFR